MKKHLPSLLLSLTAVFGITLDFPGEGLEFVYSRSFLIFPLLILVYYAIEWVRKTPDFRLKWILAVLTGFLSMFHVLGELLTEKGTVLWLLRDFGTFSSGLLHWAGYGTVLFVLFFFLFRSFSGAHSDSLSRLSRLSFPVLWLLLILAWLPLRLNQYPAVMTADTTDTIEMALGIEPLTDHHPVFYTFLVRTALRIGGLLNPAEPNQTGVVVFITVQFLLMSGVCAAVLRMILKRAENQMLRVFSLVFFLFYPVNPLYSATMWKDVPFALCLLALTALLLREMEEHKMVTVCGIMLSGILLTLFRHNGIYVIVLTLPFIYPAFKSRWKPVFFAFLTVILFSTAWSRILLPALHIPEGSPAEALSIPLQQIALTARRQHENMDRRELDELSAWFDDPEIWKQYNTRISDPVKNKFDGERYRNDPNEFWNFYIRLGKAYPQDYLDGFMLHTYGYWYPETPHWVFITGIDDEGLFGIHADPRLGATRGGDSVIRWFSDAGYDKIPLLSLLFSPGACFWLFLACFCFCLYQKSKAWFLFVPCFILWLTAAASPVNCEFRYVYGMFLCMPVLMTAARLHL